MNKIIGIIGGMGPLATCILFQKIVENTKADTDQEHIRVIIDSNSQIPDRTAAILHGGPDPVPELLKSARFLETSDPGVLIMPCNTAHYFYNEIVEQIHTPLLHMPRIAVEHIKRSGHQKVGLLATEGTLATGIYTEPLREAGIEAIVPTFEEQRCVTDLIYNVVKANKTDFDKTGIRRVIDRIFASGAGVLLIGCTELSVAFGRYDLTERYVDPQELLARAAISYVGGALAGE